MTMEERISELKINSDIYRTLYNQESEDLIQSQMDLKAVRKTAFGQKFSDNDKAFRVVLTDALNMDKDKFLEHHEPLDWALNLLNFWEEANISSMTRKSPLLGDIEDKILYVRMYTSLGEKTDDETVKSFMNKVLSSSTQSEFLVDNKDSGFTCKELEEFFWATWNIARPDAIFQIHPSMRDNQIVKTTKMDLLIRLVFLAFHKPLEDFLKSVSNVAKRGLVEFHDMVHNPVYSPDRCFVLEEKE